MKKETKEKIIKIVNETYRDSDKIELLLELFSQREKEIRRKDISLCSRDIFEAQKLERKKTLEELKKMFENKEALIRYHIPLSECEKVVLILEQKLKELK